jgi:hypothetical protein
MVNCFVWYGRVSRLRIPSSTWRSDRRKSKLVYVSTLGNTILVKLELWESVMVIISFGLPLNYAYATLRQSVAGNSTFRGIVFLQFRYP